MVATVCLRGMKSLAYTDEIRHGFRRNACELLPSFLGL
jgi:hypothetical protein